MSEFILGGIKLSFGTANIALSVHFTVSWVHSTFCYVHDCSYLLLNSSQAPWKENTYPFKCAHYSVFTYLMCALTYIVYAQYIFTDLNLCELSSQFALNLNIFLNCDEVYMTKFNVVGILKCTVQWH